MRGVPPQPRPEDRVPAQAVDHSAQAGLPFRPPTPAQRTTPSTSRKRAISPDQFDFGF